MIVRALIFISFVSWLIGCEKKEPVAAVEWSRYELSPVNGSQHLKAVMKNSDNEILEEGYVLNDLKEGQWIYYSPKGEYITKIENFISGKKFGVVLEFNDRHEMTTRSHHDQGVREGYTVNYHRGRPKMDAYYQNGQLHGRMTKYHDYSSKILSETDYKHGKQDGIYRYYDTDGNVTLDYLYKDGEKVRGGMVDPSSATEK